MRVGCEVTGTGGRARKDGRTPDLCGLPIIIVPAVTVHGVWANWIILKPIGGADGRPEIQEWIHIDLIEEDAKSTAHNQAGSGLVGESKSRRKVLVVGRENRIDTLSLDYEAAASHKNPEVVGAIAMQRTEVLIAQP